MARTAPLALAPLLALAAAPALAQWRPSPMALPAPAGAEVLLGQFTAGAVADGMLVVDPSGAATLRAPRALHATSAWPHALPAATPLAAGRTRDSNEDPLADVAYPAGTSLTLRFGTAPGTSVPHAVGPAPGPASFVHALPYGADAVAFPSAGISSGLGAIYVGNFETGPLGGNMDYFPWAADGLSTVQGAAHRVSGVRLSPAARALGVDDLAVPSAGGVFLLVHRPATFDLEYATTPVRPLDLALEEVRVGGVSALERPPWLPPSVPGKADALGAAALDLDLDGTPDLLFTYGSLAAPLAPGRLIAVAGTGDPRDLATGTWQDVTDHAALQLVDPVIVRQVAVGSFPAAAIWDRSLGQVVVVWVEGGVLRTWRGDASGVVHDVRTADLVGSAAADLVVVGPGVLVYPDVGDASPALAWEAGSPGAAIRGEDLPLSVSAMDPDGDCTVEWFVGTPGAFALAGAAAVPAGAAQVLPHVRPGATLCGPPPLSLSVIVRATDALGVFDELRAELPVASLEPALAISGASPPGRLVLPPGGTTVVLDGVAATGCGAASLGGEWPPEAVVTDESGPRWLRRTVSLPEAAYPALLADPAPAVSIATTDPGVVRPVVTLPLQLDASGLVEVVHEADRVLLGDGEIAVLRTRLRSRIAVALPLVRVRDVLPGLVPAGEPSVAGAAVVEVARGGAELVLDALPPAPAEVTVELPVRAAGGGGGSAVEARSSAGWLLTPPARAAPEAVGLPGCGCGSGGTTAGLAALALALAGRGRRRSRGAT
jgi:MYXO-CTERM domain-containing protein